MFFHGALLRQILIQRRSRGCVSIPVIASVTLESLEEDDDEEEEERMPEGE